MKHMKILIELYDNEPIYNYLASVVFRPDKVYFVGSEDIKREKCRRKTEKFADLMGLNCKFVYRAAKSNDFGETKSAIEKIIAEERANGNKCVIDVTGGRDLALVAAGCLMDEGTEIINFDKETNIFKNLSDGSSKNVDAGIPCNAFITAAGGTIYENTRNLNYTPDEWELIKKIIRIYFENREVWTRFVKYLQRISKKEGEKVGDSLDISAPLTLTEGGRTYSGNETVLRELERAGAVKCLEIGGSKISFSYVSPAMANLLVNEGVWLEISVYMIAKEMPCFFDAQTGVKFIWDIPAEGKSVHSMIADSTPRNEVDVMLSKGVTPVFISCKTRFPINEDLNELYAIKEHFGGEMATAILATTKFVDSDCPVAERAKAMGIKIIDERNFENGTAAQRLLRLTGDKNANRK